MKNQVNLPAFRLLSLPLLLLPLLSLPLLAQTGQLRIQGEAILYATPEEVSIQIPIQAKHASYEACAAALTTTYNALSDALTKSGIDRKQIKSDGLNIRENYQWTDRERVLDGYVGSINATVRMPHNTKSLNAFMKTMADERFRFGYGLNFVLSESQKVALRDQAIAMAVEDAKAKAAALAAGLGVRMLSIHEVTYGPEPAPRDMLVMRAEAKMASDMEDVEFNANTLEIRQTVTVVWLIAN